MSNIHTIANQYNGQVKETSDIIEVQFNDMKQCAAFMEYLKADYIDYNLYMEKKFAIVTIRRINKLSRPGDHHQGS